MEQYNLQLSDLNLEVVGPGLILEAILDNIEAEKLGGDKRIEKQKENEE